MAAVPSDVMPASLLGMPLPMPIPEGIVKNIDVNDPKVKAAAEFALSKYPGENLILRQVEAGQIILTLKPPWNLYYNLIISAKRCHEPLLVFCSAIVQQHHPDQSYDLISFVRLP